MKKLFLIAITAIMFMACSENEDSKGPNDGKVAYMSIKLPVPEMRSTNTENDGSASESEMKTATVLLFDNNDLCLGSIEFTAGNFVGDVASEAKSVPAKTKKIFVVVNKLNTKWDLTSSVVTGKSWSVINNYVAVIAPEISKTGEFLMTNTGTLADGALVSVTVYKTAAEAKAAPAQVFVDRVTSKVILKKANTITTPIGATFTFLGWELNTTNKQTSMYSDRVPFTSTATALHGIYRRDNNYLKSNFGTTEAEIITYIKANYNWLVNGPTSSDLSVVDRPAYVDDLTTGRGVAYCAENTMDADAQLWGHTTKVVIRGAYTPSGITAAESFFSWKSNYYNVAQLKAEYIKTSRTDLKADLVKFLTKAFPAGTTYGDLTEAEKAEETNINAVLDAPSTDGENALNAYSGIRAKYEAVMYYHNSVCYYDALINHDQSNTAKMALGRYGVVRNNAYELTLNGVKGPGTPWIPDPTDPADPTDPTDPDDEVEANLSIDVKLKKWTLWTQGVELG